LITARLANEFGRDVFAVPGSVFSPTSIGTHALLRDGAILCTGAADVLTELFPSIGKLEASAVAAPDVATLRGADVGVLRDLSVDARRLLEAIARDEPVSADELSRSLDLPAAAVLAGLFELEGAGLAAAVEGGRYGIRRS
jgi:DNA processing protein